MQYVPFVVIAILLVGLLLMSTRARRRQAAAQQQLAASIEIGSAVMTTSGLHGVVAARNDDETVQLSIAPGVEVRWEMAALRELTSLPDRYRRGAGEDGPEAPGNEPQSGSGSGAAIDPAPGPRAEEA